MTNSQIKVMVFDLGNVLIPFDYKIIIRNLNNIEEGLGGKFEKSYAENYHIHEQFERGEIPVEEFIDLMLEWSDNKLNADEFCRIYSDIFTLNKKMIDLLPVLKKKYKLVLLSNTNYIHQKYGWEKYEFLKHFDKLILSHEVGFRKPEEGIYKAVEDFTGEKPESHFFTDDVEEYVEAARLLGWEAVQFINARQILDKFGSMNII